MEELQAKPPPPSSPPTDPFPTNDTAQEAGKWQQIRSEADSRTFTRARTELPARKQIHLQIQAARQTDTVNAPAPGHVQCEQARHTIDSPDTPTAERGYGAQSPGFQLQGRGCSTHFIQATWCRHSFTARLVTKATSLMWQVRT